MQSNTLDVQKQRLNQLIELISNQELKLNLGSHISNNNNNNNNNNNSNSSQNSNNNINNNSAQYHTLRYDFKPASVNSEEPAHIEVTQTGQVTIKAPNVGGSISSQTVFRGQRRPHVKECLLVIDNKTGEMVLQKLTDNITVKATRSIGGGENGTGNGNVNGIGTGNSSSNSSSSSSSSSSSTNGIGVSSGAATAASCTINQSVTPVTKIDGPQLSEESSSSSDSSSSSRSRTSSTSSSSSSNSGNSSPNNEGFTF